MAAGTRDTLVTAALALFRSDGYDATTMRRIASEAGVSLGNAYYYFDGKDALVQELYDQIQVEHRDRTLPLLVEGAPLADNLARVLRSGLDVMAPYHGFGRTLLVHALPTRAAASPFSPESAGARTMAVALMDQVIAISSTSVRGRLRAELPRLLWFAYLGVTLHWVADASPDQRRSYVLAERAATLAGRAVALARLPVARGLVTDVVGLSAYVAGEDLPDTEEGR
ncbi:AcrR family transcriptional regulator [Mumia flava]|uniref:AcrR family transcriptional regulator n=1 Tax=Mumia flava TaxID=1348852 RepID=A0A2M9B7I1_9ACTN|nr:TetR family transcriptional regulator [Mumia flava]PJJ53906.1 AcrR family transcriptional regulator [Mumia flava]